MNESNVMTSCEKMKMMIQAASDGDRKLIRTVIKSSTPGLRLNKTMAEALVIAASNGHILAVREVLRAGCQLEEYYGGKTALLAASESGHEQIVKELHVAGADLEAKVVLDGKMNKSTSLILAAAHDHKRVVEYLINSGVNIEARNMIKETAIIVAARNGCENVVKFLGMQSNVNLEASDQKGKTALLKAIYQNNLAMVRCLYLVGADFHRNDVSNAFPVMDAIRKGNLEIVKYIASRSKMDTVSISLRDYDDEFHTPLMKAVIIGDLRIVKCLISEGARLDQALLHFHKAGGTALTEAIRHKRIDIIDILLAQKGSLDLHLAYTFYRRLFCQHCPQLNRRCCHDSCEDSVPFLIAAGAQVERVPTYVWLQLAPTYADVVNEFNKLVPEIEEDSLQSRCRQKIRLRMKRLGQVPLYKSVKKLRLELPEQMQKYLIFNVDVEKILFK